MQPDTETDLQPEHELLTVDEAAAYLRIGVTLTYQLCREWFATDGAAGIPAIRLGRKIRIPRRALERYVDTGQATDVA